MERGISALSSTTLRCAIFPSAVAPSQFIFSSTYEEVLCSLKSGLEYQ